MEEKVVEAIKQIEAASERLLELAENESAARSARTSALNRLNDLQRGFDAIINEMKSGAPRDSDWKRQWMGHPAEKKD